MKHQDIVIGEKVIGPDSRTFVIAEIGISHGGSLSQARSLIDAAAQCGADAIKFQSFRAEQMMIPSVDGYSRQENGKESSFEMMKRLGLSWDDLSKLKRHADKQNIIFLSTPFDEAAVEFLDFLGVPAFKIASSDITHIPLLRHAASKGKPILLSTGMSYLSEVAEAVWTLKSAGAKEILLLHCISAYPVPVSDINLRAIQTLREYFDLPIGFSDHSEGILLAPVAAAMGAVLIEKHFTLDKRSPGPSADPEDMKALIQNLRNVEVSLGDGRKRPCSIEEEGRLSGRRSIVSAVDIGAFETISPWMLAFKRPGGGIEPRHWQKVVGMKARHSLFKDTILQWEDLIASAPSNQLGDPALPGSRKCLTDDRAVESE